MLFEGFGDFRAARRHDDGVIRCRRGPAEGSIGVLHMNVAIAQARKRRRGAIREFVDALDGETLRGKLGQYGGGVAGARADFEYFFTALQI